MDNFFGTDFPLVVVIVICLIVIFFTGSDKRKEKNMKKQSRRYILKKCENDYFDDIYKDILSKIDIGDIQKTNLKKYFVILLIVVWILSLFHPNIFITVKQHWWGLVWGLGWIVLPITLIIVDGFKYYYDIRIINAISQIIKPNIEFEGMNIEKDVVEYKENLDSEIYKYKFKDAIEEIRLEDIYPANGFNDGFNYIKVHQYIKYDMDSNIKVNIRDISVLSKYEYFYSCKRGSNGYPCIKKGYSYADVFKGFVAKVSREKFVSNEILITKKKKIIPENQLTENFEEIFDLNSIDKLEVEFRVNEFIKSEIVRLYKEYRIMFEISLSGKDMYIRFYTDELFPKKFFTSVIDKKKLKGEFIVMKSIFEIIERLNNIL